MIVPEFSDQERKKVPHLSEGDSTHDAAFLTVLSGAVLIDEILLLEGYYDLLGLRIGECVISQHLKNITQATHRVVSGSSRGAKKES